MNEPIRGIMPVREKTLRFIEWSENLKYGEALHLPGKSPVANYLGSMFTMALRLIERPRKQNVYPFRESINNFTEKIHLDFTGILATHDVFLVLPEIAYHFDLFVPALMNQEVCTRVQMGFNIGLSETMVIESFLEDCRLTDIIELDTFKKDQYRFRNYKKIAPYTAKRGKRIVRPRF